jgi:hypothetical protein
MWGFLVILISAVAASFTLWAETYYLVPINVAGMFIGVAMMVVDGK